MTHPVQIMAHPVQRMTHQVQSMTHHVFATQAERFEVGIEYELWRISEGPDIAMLIVGNAWGEKVCVPMEYFVPCGIFKEKQTENFQRRRW